MSAVPLSACMPSGVLHRTDRQAFVAALDAEIARAAAAGEQMGLLLVRLRGVEELNFAFGYAAVDDALTEIAARLEQAFLPRADVVRIGTSRFAIVLRGLESDAHALLAAQRVARLADEALVAGALSAPPSFAQGLALYPEHAASGEELLQCAEMALVVASRVGAPVRLYGEDGRTELQQLRRVGEELSFALGNGGIEAHFQPQIDIRTGRPVGAEALLRCRDREGTPLPPEIVVAVAEKTNRMADLTASVLNTSLRHAAEWPVPGLRLSVNISPRSLRDADFPGQVADALAIWGRRPEDLTLEITESVFIDEPEKSLAAMRELTALGVRVAIDDFGTGYSSLSYFTNIPADELKVDKSFVLAMLDNDGAQRIVQAVVNLAHGFDLEVVAEGIENEATLAALRETGCDVGQGFGIGRPMAPARFVEWLNMRRTAVDSRRGTHLPLLP